MEEYIMGLKEFVKKNYEESKQRSEERREQNRQAMLEYNQQTHCPLVITSGCNHLLSGSNCTMHQRPDGSVFFNNNKTRNYRLLSYTWNGPLYDSITNTNTNTNTNGTEIKKGKAGKIVGGALVGAMINPAGALVGAAAGAGSKGQKRTHSTSNSNSVSTTKNVEVATPGSIKLRCIETNEVFGILFNCTSILDAKIRLFNFDGEQTPYNLEQQPQNFSENNSDTLDNFEQIKKLKELLDIGAITQEEFEMQKAKLLS